MRPGSEMILDTQQHPHVLKSGNKNNKSKFHDQDKESVTTKAKQSPPSGKTTHNNKKANNNSPPSANAKSKPIPVSGTTKSPSSGSIIINNNSQLKSHPHLMVGYGIQHQMALAAQVQYHKARLARNGGGELSGAQPRPKAYTPPNTQSIIHARNVLNKRNGGSGGGLHKGGGVGNKQGGEYYAGAKFDTVPSIAVLPSPPVSWTDPALRSQSQPSSPIPKMMQQQQQPISSRTGSQFAVDLATLFGVGVVRSDMLLPKVAQVKVGC